jgi:hypothetical protein
MKSKDRARHLTWIDSDLEFLGNSRDQQTGVGKTPSRKGADPPRSKTRQLHAKRQPKPKPG